MDFAATVVITEAVVAATVVAIIKVKFKMTGCSSIVVQEGVILQTTE